jgi:rod shape-determining protein MreD
MSLYFGIPIMLVGAVLQSVWLEDVRIFGGRPDLVLLLVITWSIIRGLNEGMVWGLVGGIIIDLLVGGPVGLWTISLVIAAFLAGQPWVQTLGPTSIRLALMSALGTLAAHTVFLALMGLLGYPVDAGWAYGTVVGPAALLNFILSPFSFVFLVWFHRRSPSRGGIGL